MWDLPGPGVEPVSPALAGRYLTTVSPGKSSFLKNFKFILFFIFIYVVIFISVLYSFMWIQIGVFCPLI